MLRRFGNIFDVVATVARVLRLPVPRQTSIAPAKQSTFTGQIEDPEFPLAAARGPRRFHRYDLTACIGCGRCARNCLRGCIHVGKERVPGRRGLQITSFTVDYARCMVCGACTELCPTNCIVIDSVIDSSQDLSRCSREGSLVDLSRLPVEVAWGPPTFTRPAAARRQTVARTTRGPIDQYGGRDGT